MKKIIALLIVLFILVGCAPKQEKNLLKILTSSGYPPYEMTKPDGTLEGFDIDFGEALAIELGYDGVEWVDMDFGGIIAALNNDGAHMAIAGMSADPERDVLFSVPYLIRDEESPFYVLTKKDSGITDTPTLANKIVGVQIGTIQEGAVNAMKAELNLTVDPRNDIGQMVQEIIVGRIDFIIVEGLVAKEYVAQFTELSMFLLEHEAADSVPGVVVTLPKTSTMKAAVDAAIEKLIANGTLAALEAKWFDE
ncbi:MAG: transporter substrate-binding domain-containing protein [Erysipelotrichaceae bacterium]|nr:transporter substrate-binding domain-containing protein [Erysipelotrichaceae bacterium]